MLSILPSTIILGLAALAALGLAQSRRSPPSSTRERRVAARALAFAVGVQSIHFAEETATGFHDRFPALLGLPGMSLFFFVIFNVTWLAIWVAAVAGLRSERVSAFFAAWFLAIAGMMNGVAHPLMALVSGGYFPGLVTSPVIGAASVLLWLRLREATQSRDASRTSGAGPTTGRTAGRPATMHSRGRT